MLNRSGQITIWGYIVQRAKVYSENENNTLKRFMNPSELHGSDV